MFLPSLINPAWPAAELLFTQDRKAAQQLQWRRPAFVKKPLWLEMSSQFCQAYQRNGVAQDKEKGKTILPPCMVLSAWGCTSVTRSSPAAELQHLMCVETLTCLEFSPTSYFHLLSGELWEHQGLVHPNLLSRRNQVITTCRYMCCAFIGEGTQNASLTWIPVTTGMEPDEINPLPVIPFTKYPSHGCSQHHWFQREGARHLPKGRFLPVSVWGESVQPAWRLGWSLKITLKVTVSH